MFDSPLKTLHNGGGECYWAEVVQAEGFCILRNRLINGVRPVKPRILRSCESLCCQKNFKCVPEWIVVYLNRQKVGLLQKLLFLQMSLG